MKTVSLELLKQLKKAGYPVKTSTSQGWTEYGMVTADEILDLLPKDIEYPVSDIGTRDARLTIIKNYEGDFTIYYLDARADHIVKAFTEKLIADAAAKMWLYLKKENLI